jgi:uncharacterized protein YjbI with pentapeptide repeats
MLRFVDFSGVALREISFGAAALDHARFRGSTITAVDFGGIPNSEIRAPFAPDPSTPMWLSALNGIDFSGAFIDRSSFRSSQAFGANFDSAFISNTDFADAALGAATFRNAMIYECTFAGTNLSGVDLSGAIVFGADFLTLLEAASDQQSFVAARFSLEPIDAEAVSQHPRVLNIDPAIYAALEAGTLEAFRVVRIAPFESNPGRATTVFDR